MADHHHHHGHGVFDQAITRSRAGVRAVSASLAVLAITAALQGVVVVLSGSVALLADFIHNGGDALTALPLGAAFLLRSQRAERAAGYIVVAAILFSALVAGYEAVDRLINPRPLDHLAIVGGVGLVGFIGNEIAARIRLRAGERLGSPALLADGAHARADGYVSLGVVASSILVAVGADVADPLTGLVMTAVILKLTFNAWRTIAHHHRQSG